MTDDAARVAALASELCRTTPTVLTAADFEDVLRRMVAIGVPLYQAPALITEWVRVGRAIEELISGLEDVLRR